MLKDWNITFFSPFYYDQSFDEKIQSQDIQNKIRCDAEKLQQHLFNPLSLHGWYKQK